MKSVTGIISILTGALVLVTCSENHELVFRNGAHVVFSGPEGEKAPYILSKNDSLIGLLRPVRIEIFDRGNITTRYPHYTEIESSEEGLVAKSSLTIDDATLLIRDTWRTGPDHPELHRKIEVKGHSTKAFLSATEFDFTGHRRDETDYFVPGMIYGGTGQINPEALGGKALYEKGDGKLWIREDRMPAPLMAIRFNQEHYFSILNPSPDGRTTLEDANDLQCRTLVDEDLRFGSMFSEHMGDTLRMGYAFPGSEGSFTYSGTTFPGGQLHRWRRRYHPLKEGIQHEYRLSFHMDTFTGFREFYTSVWLNAFAVLDPSVNYQDIEQVRSVMLSILPGLMVRKQGRTGLSNWYDATDPSDTLIDNKAVFGFTGKNIEAAYYLLYHAREHPGAEYAEYPELAEEIIGSFLSLRVDPPEGEGYYFDTGRPALAIPSHQRIYARSFGDAMKVLARAYHLEKEHGILHQNWYAWMEKFGNWLLEQQYPGGGFPRAWFPGSGAIASESEESSYNMIPFLCEMHSLSAEKKWLDAALAAGEFSWNSGQNRGRFTGGTIDNPDVIDKEAGTLSAEAYLALYEATENEMWLERAQTAALFAETWIYIWDVPMVPGDREKQWADGVTTVGLQLISTGHSLVDNYMAFDVDTYAKLFAYGCGEHNRRVAELLLHNTKSMLALPGRTYQYRSPGWIQEHWSLAPPRGKGLHPGWLPWITTSNLNGICETEIFDRELFESMKTSKTNQN